MTVLLVLNFVLVDIIYVQSRELLSFALQTILNTDSIHSFLS